MADRRGGLNRALLLLSGSLALCSVGCENHLCDPSSASWGMTGGQGDLQAPGVWESSPVEGTWVPFPHQVTLTFDFSAYFPHCYGAGNSEVLISPDEMPAANDAGNATWGGGNVAEIEGLGTPGILQVYNDTCADYFMYARVTCPTQAATATDAAPEAASAAHDP